VAVVKEAQLDSHAKVQSLVGGDLDAPTAAVARVLMFDGLLDVVEVQQLDWRRADRVAGTEAHVLVVSLGRCVQ